MNSGRYRCSKHAHTMMNTCPCHNFTTVCVSLLFHPCSQHGSTSRPSENGGVLIGWRMVLSALLYPIHFVRRLHTTRRQYTLPLPYLQCR
ncbi:hypothetical protein Y032_0101g3357 [Ancylostoma ceylanicum]|uniref:Uncharacterized protein n=1 Tax=Ancylostoma ceylanicum TaxID=53326 RepID=A0A016THR3_9BILA|nr:hypothetical protein Y032_0101g3357 [Ancylostoma ceylanicum]